MGKYFCDYCDVFLVSESPSVRKAHNSGRNHLTNVRDYYASMGHDKAQNIIDEITRMYENGPPNQRPQINNFGPGPGMLAPRPPLPPQNFSAVPPPSGFGGPPSSGPPSFGGPPPQQLPPMRFGGPPPPGPPGGFGGPGGGGGASPPPPPASAPVSGPAGRMDPARAKMLGLM